MSKLDVLNTNGVKVKDITLNKEVFGIVPNDAVLYDAIKLAQNNARQATKGVKGRSDVSGGGRKPWRQKGTGRARQGSIRSVQWVGGGNYGTPVPRDYSKKQNRKERQLAIRSALAEKVNANEMMVVENLTVTSPKTKEVLNILEKISLACDKSNRKPSDVKLMAVSKFHPVEEILQAYDCGLKLYGENRVQEIDLEGILVNKIKKSYDYFDFLKHRDQILLLNSILP